ncbi:MAG: exonuclease subunit SbcD [Bacteriovoracaceae bacterium]|nr:exonuclease subunit SbcD [Bacteriovoracaceae bacterium]
MAIRILHTSDWHLGKKLSKVDRIFEQKLFLKWLLQTILEQQIDYLIIAGDIFDSPGPPDSAVKVYFDFLEDLHKHTSCHAIIIAGNHDSGRFLDAPQEILRSKRIHLWGQLKNSPSQHSMELCSSENPQEKVHLVALPYFRFYELFHLLGSDLLPLEQSEGLVLNLLEKFFEQTKSTSSENYLGRILVTHHLFGNFELAGSEQALSLSSSDVTSIPPQLLKPFFDYVALGHIHKKQVVSKEEPVMIYCGSPIPMRFSETQEKVVSLLTFAKDQQEKYSQSFLPIPCFRKLFSIHCHLDTWEYEIDKILRQSDLTPYGLPALLDISITIPAPTFGLSDKVRKKIEGSSLELVFFSTPLNTIEKEDLNLSSAHLNLSPLELFEKYYALSYPENPQIPVQIKDDFLELLQKSQSDETPASDTL